MKTWLLILIPCFQLQAQTGTCILKEPAVTINFGAGEAVEMNSGVSYSYQRVMTPCPTDGHYAYIPYTSDCFRGDWITLEQDHTPGDQSGNMLVVNSSYRSGVFYNTSVTGLKPGVNYEFSVFMLNLCKPSEKCPYPLLPNITIEMKTPEGIMVLEKNTGDLKRYGRAEWTKFALMFKMPKAANSLDIVMTNHSPGGCGNDFAMDDLSFRECVITPPPIAKKASTSPPKKNPPTTTRSSSPPSKKDPVTAAAPKKTTAPTTTVTRKPAIPKPVAKAPVTSKPKKENSPATVTTTARKPDTVQKINPKPKVFPPPPAPLTNRTNPVVKKFDVDIGTIKVELYDNGQIDGDTVSIYHNNKLILSRVRLSEKAISFNIAIDEASPHHELIMVANNLGSIPPNTSLMYVTAGAKRYEVFISSTEKQNAKIVFDLSSN